MNRSIHCTAPLRPPNSVCSAGNDDMMSAMIDTSPSVRLRNLSKLSYSPFLSFSMPRLSIRSLSSPPLELPSPLRLMAGMVIGHTVYRCASRTGSSSSHDVDVIANIAASGKPSPRVPLNPSAWTRTIKFAARRSSRYFLPIDMTGSPLAAASSRPAASIASLTILATPRILPSSWASVFIFPLTIFLHCKRRFPTDLLLSKSFRVERASSSMDIRSVARVM
mmetsp:Transcript_26170/g.59011  ORF Transcript_26170/g.59011 Transcript_26170/m.59011 type:complete len:222 (+) Transcript_26170:835-1500(+)